MLTQKLLVGQQGAYDSLAAQESMPPTKINGFFLQFPWAKKYASGPVRQVHVSRIEPSLLSYQRQVDDIGLYEQVALHERILLLDENGAIVVSETAKILGPRKYWLFGPRSLEPATGDVGEYTIGSVLKTLGKDAGLVRFIFSYYAYTRAIIVYKAPKDLTIPEWIEQQISAEREQFQAACDTIDAEAIRE